MSIDVVLDAALVVGLRPSALPVLAMDLVRLMLLWAMLSQLATARRHEEAGVAAVHQRHADAGRLGGRQQRFQPGDPLDHDLRRDRARKPDRLEEPLAV